MTALPHRRAARHRCGRALPRLCLGLIALLLAGCSATSAPGQEAPRQTFDGRAAEPAVERWARLGDLLRFPFDWECPAEPPGHRLTPDEAASSLAAAEGRDSVTWIGHATVLIRLGGLTILTDPVFGSEVSPLPTFGPCRMGPPGLALDDLPPIDVVLVSHDHYDHFEPATIRALAQRHPLLCLLPLQVGAGLAPLGCAETRFLDWGDSVERGGVRFTFLPAQHWSARGLLDRNTALWGSFAMASDAAAIYFAGDTGYGPHFRAIGDSAGTFDLALLPIGGYEPRDVNKAVHIDPDEALRALDDLRAAALLPIHWGTFDLGAEGPYAPAAILRAGAARASIGADRIWLLRLGETRTLRPR